MTHDMEKLNPLTYMVNKYRLTTADIAELLTNAQHELSLALSKAHQLLRETGIMHAVPSVECIDEESVFLVWRTINNEQACHDVEYG